MLYKLTHVRDWTFQLKKMYFAFIKKKKVLFGLENISYLSDSRWHWDRYKTIEYTNLVHQYLQ